jgi:hypothetical protein
MASDALASSLKKDIKKKSEDIEKLEYLYQKVNDDFIA